MEIDEDTAREYFNLFERRVNKSEAFDYLHSDITERERLNCLLGLLEFSETEKEVGLVGAGPLEDLLFAGTTEAYGLVDQELRKNKKLREALAGVWVFDDNPSYELYVNLREKYLTSQSWTIPGKPPDNPRTP